MSLRVRKTAMTIAMTLMMVLASITFFSGKSFALESTGNSTLDAFINDSRFTAGASWAYNKGPMLASFGSQGCCAYCADYVKYCYGVNNPRSGSAFYNVSEIRAGDVLTVGNQSDGTGHWFVCLKRSGNSLYVAEGNVSNKVRIGWNYTISGNKFAEDSRSFTAGYHYLAATLTAKLSVEHKYYNPGDTVTFSFSGDNANGRFTLGIFKDNTRIKTIDVNAYSYSIQLNDTGSYSAYMTSYSNSGGLADSNWVSWQILPLTAGLSADKTKCNVNDKVTLSFKGNNSNAFANGRITLAVWCNNEYVVHKDVTTNKYEVVCDKPGEYKSYMTAYGGGALKDSNWVYWTVYPLTAELSADKTKCNVNDKVTLSFKGNNSNAFENGRITLAVWCNNEYVVHKDVTTNKYEVVCDKPGEYKSYMTAYGGGALKDSNWVYWTVYPLTAELSADKTKCNVNDKVTLSFKGNNSNSFSNGRITLAVWCNGKYVVHKDITSHSFVVKCDQPGEYKSYMTAYGGGTLKDSNWVSWTVYPRVLKTNPLKIKISKKTYKQSKLKKAVSFSIGTTQAQGKVTYTVDKKAKKAKIKVTAKGKVLIPKKCKKGTYKITVKAAGNKNYKAGKKVVKIIVR